MIKRDLQQSLLTLAKQFPIVTITGPRQSGKTTLAKATFPKKPYVNLELIDVRNYAITDPRGFLSQFPNGAVLDEIQKAPDILSYIQGIVDEHNIKGEFILTGSHQLELHQAITQSLAGRTALLTLLPLSINELDNSNIDFTLDEYLITGFFPRIYNDKLEPNATYRSYVQTYIEKDVRQIINVKDLDMFQRFLKLCAGRIGSILNMDSLSNDLGISGPTIKHWFSTLQASFITFKLQPYFENFGKRIIKSPKIYFTDVGLACYLLDIENITQLKRDPLRGFLVENLVILELMKSRLNHGNEPNLYYYRDSKNNEIDLIYKTGSEIVPIEIKAGETFNTDYLKGLQFLSKLIPNRISESFLVYAGTNEFKINNTQVLNFKNAPKVIK